MVEQVPVGGMCEWEYDPFQGLFRIVMKDDAGQKTCDTAVNWLGLRQLCEVIADMIQKAHAADLAVQAIAEDVPSDDVLLVWNRMVDANGHLVQPGEEPG